MSHPSLPKPPTPQLPPDLEGAVDLANPVQLTIAGFKQKCAQVGVEGVVLVALVGDKGILLSFHCPGGQLQALGMMQKAAVVMTMQSMQGPPTAIPMPEPIEQAEDADPEQAE